MKPMPPSPRGFTLVELLIVLVLLGIVTALAGPSLYDFVLTQRLKGISASLVTDLQYARSEAVSRGKNVWISFQQPAGGDLTCYTIYTHTATNAAGAGKCDCTQAPASRCVAGATELKTEQVPTSLGVKLALDPTATEYPFDPISGGKYIPPTDVAFVVPPDFLIDVTISTARTLRIKLAGMTGRPVVCLPSGASVSGGYPAC